MSGYGDEPDGAHSCRLGLFHAVLVVIWNETHCDPAIAPDVLQVSRYGLGFGTQMYFGTVLKAGWAGFVIATHRQPEGVLEPAYHWKIGATVVFVYSARSSAEQR